MIKNVNIVNIIVYLIGFAGCYWAWGKADDEMKDYMFYMVFIILLVQGNYQTFIINKLKKELEDVKKT